MTRHHDFGFQFGFMHGEIIILLLLFYIGLNVIRPWINEFQPRFMVLNAILLKRLYYKKDVKKKKSYLPNFIVIIYKT